MLNKDFNNPDSSTFPLGIKLLSKSRIRRPSDRILGRPNNFFRVFGVNHLTGDRIGLLVSNLAFFEGGGDNDADWDEALNRSFKACL